MKLFGLVVFGGIFVVVFGVIFLLVLVQCSDVLICFVDLLNYFVEGVNGYKGDQFVNVVVIIGVVQQFLFGEDVQIIGVMMVMGESSFKNIIYGDDINGVVNFDGILISSIGLF